MLAYVFSHRAAPGVDATVYEEALRRFHAALARSASSGFVSSTTYRIGDVYSDWYLVESSAALDGLNAAARMAVDGSGKLLSLHSGELLQGPGFEIRFAKPAGMSYPELYADLEPWTGRQAVSLWRRMMVLGPPPEFCLVAPSALELPVEMRPEVLGREPI